MKRTHDHIANGVNYLIPKKWWQAYQQIQPSQSQISSEENSSPSTLPPFRNYIEPFLLDFQQHLKKQIQAKTKIGRIDTVTVSPLLKKNRRWKIVTPQLWQDIRTLSQEQISIPILFDNSNTLQYYLDNLVQLQILFCSQTKIQLFIGYFPSSQKVFTIVEQIGGMLGFHNFNNSHISNMELELPEELGFEYWSFLEARELKQVIEIRNLYHSSQYMLQSMDIGTYLKPIDQIRQYQFDEEMQNQRGSMSTKVDTPKIYGIEDHGETLRIYKIIHSNKHPEQIQFLRQKVEKALKEPKIEIPQQFEEEEVRGFLEELAKESLIRMEVKEQNF